MRDPVHDYLTAKHISMIAGFMPIYRWAAGLVGEMTPLMIVPLHIREADLKRTAKIPGGPFQFDPGGTKGLRQRIKEHVEKVCVRYGQSYEPVNESFEIAALVAADWLKYKSRGKSLAIRNQGQSERLADAFWGYNGRSGWHTADGKYDHGRKSWRFSPYVVNDPKRGVLLRLKGTLPDGKGSRVTIDRIERRPGALVLYQEMKRRLPELRASEGLA